MSESPEATPLGAVVCKECGRTFGSQADLDQHTLAKHTGSHTQTKPEWVSQDSETRAEEEDETRTSFSDCGELGSHECKICGQKFTLEALEVTRLKLLVPVFSSHLVQRHMGSLKPPTEILEFECGRCRRSFRTDRALKQHQNSCFTSSPSIEQTEAPSGAIAPPAPPCIREAPEHGNVTD